MRVSAVSASERGTCHAARTVGERAVLGSNTNSVTPPPPRPWLMGLLYELHDKMRKVGLVSFDSRVGKCNRVRIAPIVQVAVQGSTAHFHGIMRCANVWACPTCMLRIRIARAAEVTRAVEWHRERYGVDGCALLSLTVRHGLGDDLTALRAGVANVWRKVVNGAPWKRQTARYGLVGWIKALEVTAGPNGFHPHLHLVLLTERPLDDAFRAWLTERWKAKVADVLGAEHIPNEERGVVVTALHEASYLTKLGLELTAPTKAGRHESRTPLQFLADACDGDEASVATWHRYTEGMYGARMLTWSRGLKAAAGVQDKSDAELVDGELGPETIVCELDGAVWDAHRDTPGFKVGLLEAARSVALDGSVAVLDRFFAALPQSALPPA